MMQPDNLRKTWSSLQEDLSRKESQGYTARSMALKNGDEIALVAVSHKSTSSIGVLFETDALNDENKRSLPTCKHLDIFTRRNHTKKTDSVFLVLENNLFLNQFSFLVSELIDSLGNRLNNISFFPAFVSQVNTWRMFLENADPEGLSAELQRGLFGELSFIEEALEHLDHSKAIHAWKGAEKKSKDFIFGTSAIEVKSTALKRHIKVSVANEYQLDSTGLTSLFLIVFSLQEDVAGGRTLSEIIEEIRKKIAHTPDAAGFFEIRLRDYGYLDNHKEKYITRYGIMNRMCCQVVEGFPCFTAGDIPEGVGDVSYTIATSACIPYSTEFSDMCERIKNGT